MLTLSPTLINGVLGNASQQVMWRKATLCPCRDSYSGAARPGCPVCGAKGVVWAQPVEAWCVPSGMRIQRQWRDFGKFESGDVVMSIPSDSPLWIAGENDRVLLTQSTEPFSAVLEHTGTETLPYAAQTVQGSMWLLNQQIPVEGGLPVVLSDGTVDWSRAIGPVPPEGAQYSLSGRRYPEFFVYGDLPGDRAHYGGLALPRKVAMRKFDLFGK